MNFLYQQEETGELKKIAQQLRALAILAEDLMWQPEPTVLIRNAMQLQFQGTQALF